MFPITFKNNGEKEKKKVYQGCEDIVITVGIVEFTRKGWDYTAQR